MDETKKKTTLTISMKTMESLKTIKSCYQLAYRKDISYEEIIDNLIEKGLESVDKKIHKLFNTVIDDEETADQEQA